MRGEGQKNIFNHFERRRDRTCNLLIRSQAPCHWASRPIWVIDAKMFLFQNIKLGTKIGPKSRLGPTSVLFRKPFPFAISFLVATR
jgi:hypothetical protein